MAILLTFNILLFLFEFNFAIFFLSLCVSGVTQEASNDILSSTNDDFITVPTGHNKDFTTISSKTYKQISSFDPEKIDIQNVVVGDENIVRMAPLYPLKETDKLIWHNNPVLWISTEASLGEMVSILEDTMARLFFQYKSKDTHILIFTGLADIPTLNIGNAFNMFLEIIETAITFNFSNNANFSISFGEIQFQGTKAGRNHDVKTFLLNEVIRVINHYFLQAQSIKLWKLGTEPVVDLNIPNLINVLHADMKLRVENYVSRNVFNPATLFKINKYIRLSLIKRFDAMGQIMKKEYPLPTGMDKDGNEIVLKSPITPLMYSHLSLCDILVSRVKRKLELESGNQLVFISNSIF